MEYPQEKVKPYGQEGKKVEQVERMFDHIAPAYDRLNHLMSLGIDRSWRRTALKWLRPHRPALVLDVATGTGDFAIQACRMLPSASLTGVDLSEGMMQVGRRKVEQAGLAARIDFQPYRLPTGGLRGADVQRRLVRRRHRGLRHPQLRAPGPRPA